MQDIRNILSIAASKVISGDVQAAITYYETSFAESQKIDYIGGLFCSCKRLGDIYYSLSYLEHSMSWYKFACSVISDGYLEDPLIMETVLAVMQRIVEMASENDQWKEEESYYKEEIEKIKNRKTETKAGESYDAIIKKQEFDNRLYDSFFNGCRKNSLRSVLRCIHKGLDINHVNPQTKYTALHNACWRGHKEIVCALLRHGADMTMKNGEGEDCIQCAEIAKQNEIVELLKRVQKEGISFLGPCNECEKCQKKGSCISWETDELAIAKTTYSGFTL